MQGQALKLRLNNLKKASIELKSKVLNEPKINYEIISEIIASIVPQKYPEANQIQSSHHTDNSEVSISRSKHMSATSNPRVSTNSLAYSPASSIFLVPPSTKEPNSTTPSKPIMTLERMAGRQRSSSNESMHSKDTVETEIEKLRLHNDQIENSIQNLSDDLANLHKKELQLEEESWKENLPFIHQQGNTGIFITKLFVKEYDYDKIDYEKGKAELINDKLQIHLPIKPLRDYKLSSLAEVKYIGDKCMKIDFKIQQTIFVFLHFDSGKEREVWDLALFVNHKIITSKDLDNTLFQEVKEKEREDLTPHFSKKSKSKSSLKFNEESEGLTDYRGNELRNENLRKSSLKVSDRRMDKSNASKGSQGSSMKRDESSRYINQIQYTLGNNFQANQNFANTFESSGNYDKAFNDLIVFGEVGDSIHQSRTNTSKFNQADVNFQSMEFNNQLQSDVLPMIPPEKIQEQRQQMRWEEAMKELKHGYFFTKYAKDGLKPHNKKVFISGGEESLICMNSADPKDCKVIPIDSIKKIHYPDIGEGIRKFMKNPIKDNFCVIDYSQQGTEKVMELGTPNSKFISRFAEQLSDFLKKKGGHINN